MARRSRRRRNGLVAILFPGFHRSYRKVKHDMRPDRAIGRMMSWPEVKAGLRSLVGTQTTRVTEQTRRKQVAAVQRKESAAKKKATRVVQPRAAGKTTVKRKKNGQFNGREAMPGHERTLFDRAEQQRVDPALLPRSARSRKQRPAGY